MINFIHFSIILFKFMKRYKTIELEFLPINTLLFYRSLFSVKYYYLRKKNLIVELFYLVRFRLSIPI